MTRNIIFKVFLEESASFQWYCSNVIFNISQLKLNPQDWMNESNKKNRSGSFTSNERLLADLFNFIPLSLCRWLVLNWDWVRELQFRNISFPRTEAELGRNLELTFINATAPLSWFEPNCWLLSLNAKSFYNKQRNK